MLHLPNLTFLGLGLAFSVAPSPAQAETDMDPPLGLHFPLVSTNSRVALSRDVLIRSDRTLAKGTVLRTVFVPAVVTSEDQKSRRGIDETAFSREAPKTSNRNPMSDLERKMTARAFAVIWTDPLEFRRAMDAAPSPRLRLVLEPAGTNLSPRIEVPDFPEGLCLVGSHSPLVLTVARNSRGAQAGLRPGDLILELAGKATDSNLETFARQYAQAREICAKQRQPLPLRVRRTNGEVENLSIRIPPAWVNLLDEV